MARHDSHARRVPGASPTFVFGVNPVLETLRSAPASIERVLVARGARATDRVAAEARARGVTVEPVARALLDRHVGGGHHQGVAARTRPFVYTELGALLDRAAPLLVALDGVTDPQNLGSIIRSAEVLGAGGLILPRDRSAGVTAAVVRASSGASAHLPIAQVVNLVRALALAKERGYWVIGLDGAGTSRFRELPPLERALMMVGGEGKGSRPLVQRECDFLVRIPTHGRVESLNASVAAAIGLHELARRVLNDRSEASDS